MKNATEYATAQSSSPRPDAQAAERGGVSVRGPDKLPAGRSSSVGMQMQRWAVAAAAAADNSRIAVAVRLAAGAKLDRREERWSMPRIADSRGSAVLAHSVH